MIGIGLIATLAVPTIRTVAQLTTRYFDDLVDGVRYVAHHAFVRWILVLFGVVFVLAAAPSYLTPPTPAMTILRETVEPERQGRVFGVVSIAPSGRRSIARGTRRCRRLPKLAA